MEKAQLGKGEKEEEGTEHEQYKGPSHPSSKDEMKSDQDRSVYLRYCYFDADSADRLEPIVSAALELWKPATRLTSLKIEVDEWCNGDPRCLCVQAANNDALMLRDISRPGDDAFNNSPECYQSTSLGYTTKDWGNQLEFCALSLISKTYKNAVMAHELGHVMGLEHEHQRPDAESFLDFNYKVLEDYADALDAAERSKECKAMPIKEIEMKMTQDIEFAARHGFLALTDWKPFDAQDSRHKIYSTEFDYDSIMLYSSILMPERESDQKLDPKTFIIKRKGTEEPVWEGGARKPSEMKVSQGDIARLVAMYPKSGSTDAVAMARWGAAPSVYCSDSEAEESVTSPYFPSDDDSSPSGAGDSSDVDESTSGHGAKALNEPLENIHPDDQQHSRAGSRAPLDARSEGAGFPLPRRWHGIHPLAAPQKSRDQPRVEGDRTIGPWPPANGELSQKIRYCYVDRRSALRLDETVRKAIKIWLDTVGKASTSLEIILDPGCRGDIYRYCGSPGVSLDALQIRDVSKDDAEPDSLEWNFSEACIPLATYGYRYDIKDDKHIMELCRLADKMSNRGAASLVEAAIHEFGHMMGLLHEHQRPDRDNFIEYKPWNIVGYQEAFERAMRTYKDPEEVNSPMPPRLKPLRPTSQEIHVPVAFGELIDNAVQEFEGGSGTLPSENSGPIVFGKGKTKGVGTEALKGSGASQAMAPEVKSPVERIRFEGSWDELMDMARKHLNARRLFPAAIPYTCLDEASDLTDYQWSQEYDYDSIMHYPSLRHDGDPDNEAYYIISRKHAPEGERGIWPGGARNVRESRPSAGDAAKVRQLYPVGGIGSVVDLKEWKPAPHQARNDAHKLGDIDDVLLAENTRFTRRAAPSYESGAVYDAEGTHASLDTDTETGFEGPTDRPEVLNMRWHSVRDPPMS